jgi:4-hydroxy-3-polyprenylbenzoate decarboxylase
MTTSTEKKRPRRVIVAITGASGAIYGVRILEALRTMNVESHLIMSRASHITLKQETDQQLDEVEALAAHVHAPTDLAAPIASGSFRTHGMVIAPCSIKTLSSVANSHSSNLLTRAADVTLKEGRPLILAVREAPFHLGHLRLMVRAAELGAVIFPPIPSFYAHPESVDDLVDQTVGRILARLGLDNALYAVWRGLD